MTSQPPPPPPPSQPRRPAGPDQRLTRSAEDRMVAGVCAGMADYLHVDPTVIRVLAVLALIFTFPAAGIVYLVLWAVIPEDRRSWG
ncbi:MAG: PspC domain-containing protein [Marmoricola sp.]